MKTVTGECTPNCGVCCSILVVPIPSAEAYATRTLADDSKAVVVPLTKDPSEEWLHFLLTRGAKIDDAARYALIPLDEGQDPVVDTYGAMQVPALYLRTTCPFLLPDKQCALYGSPDRPAVCAKWPEPEDDLSVVKDVCSYQIVEVADDDDGAGPDGGCYPGALRSQARRVVHGPCAPQA